MTTSTANARSADEPHPSPQSDAEEDDLPGPSSTLQKTTTSTANARSADEPHPSLQSDAEEDDLPGPSSTLQKMTTSTANARSADEPHPSPQSDAEEDDLPGPSSTLQKTTTSTANARSADEPHPSPQSDAEEDDLPGPSSTLQKTTTSTANARSADEPHPSPQSDAEEDDLPGPSSTLQKMTTSTANARSADEPHPSPQSDAEEDDLPGPSSTLQKTTTSTANARSADEPHPSPQSDAEEDDLPGPSSTLQKIVTDVQTQGQFFPLRRTKSIIMKYTNLEEPGQLYDSSSGSGEEYIPDTTSESDGNSDASLCLNPRQKQQSLDHPMDISGPLSPTVCDSTTSDKMTFDNDRHGVASELTEVYEEPCSSQSQNSSVVVNACKKKDGKRVYDKRHYCWYCCKPYAKIARHLERAHKDKSDVAKALSFPKGSKKRHALLDYIRNKGNFAHNASVMESGKGELVPFRRPTKEAQGNDFMHCAYCQGLYKRKVLWQHMNTCKVKPGSVVPTPGKNRVQSMCAYTMPVPPNITKKLWGVISAMNPDLVTNIVKNDQVIIDIGQHLLNKGGLSAKNQQCVREKMREMGRLVENARRYTSLKKMEDFINPKKYMETVKAVKVTCGYDSETNKFLIPSLANKLGNALVKVSKFLKAQGLITNNEELVRNATDFQAVHQEKWNAMISATALRNIREAKWNMPTLLPFTEDVQKLHSYLNQVHDNVYNSLSESPSTKAWKELAKVCLADIILFNRRREGEVANMTLATFSSRDTSDPHEDVDWALSEVEKKLCRHFSRIVTRGKRGRPVPILLTPKMLSALDLLVKQREACGVLKDNYYVFARPGAMSHFRGSDCLRNFAKECGAKCPKLLTSTRLRKHAATLSTVLNMTDTEMDQLANFLGHDIRIHRAFYRLPEKTLQLAKISKVLMALEQGRLAEFHGKNLDEIGIDPDENVLDCDEDRCTQEGSCSSAEDEPADETLPPTERNEMPPPPKRFKPLPSDDNVASGVTSSSKGKSTRTKKTPWQQTEVQAVERHMKRFITSFTVPTKSDCEKCLHAEPEALQKRDWKNLKFYIYNRITAYKKSVQHK
ncbi:uncharacterized protein LOC118470783 isoform X2 [Amphiprion ocellaris]|nr:uncharacterized protein LOC118470783 isoform X2 [Amphiprion ocellaris]